MPSRNEAAHVCALEKDAVAWVAGKSPAASQLGQEFAPKSLLYYNQNPQDILIYKGGEGGTHLSDIFQQPVCRFQSAQSMNRLARRLVKALSLGNNLSGPTTLGGRWHEKESSIVRAIAPRLLLESPTPCGRTFASSVVPPSRVTSEPAVPRRDKRNFHWTSLALLIPPAIAALLGKWQLDRRQWKIQLLEERRTMIVDQPSVDAAALFSPQSPPVNKEYQRVTVRGRMDDSRSAFVGPRPRSQMGVTELGYLVVTPVFLDEGDLERKNSPQIETRQAPRAVMVLRGWAPVEWVDRLKSENRSSNTDRVTMEGVIRHGEDPGMFVPPNSAAKGTFYYVNPRELAIAAGLPESTPLIEIVSPEQDTKLVHAGGPPTAMEVLGGRGKTKSSQLEQYPLPKSVGDMLSFSVMPRDHTNYAATWFTLSGATALMATRILQKGLKK
jgi:surfeit locus 1 family protein